MRARAVGNILGSVLDIFSLTFILPILCGIYFKEDLFPLLLAFRTPAIISLGLGRFLDYSCRNVKDIRDNEGFAAVGLGWLVIAAIGALPYILLGAFPVTGVAWDVAGNNVVNAWFESMSGFTTTGATVLEMPTGGGTYYPTEFGHSLILWRAETQWIGGMGIIVLSVVFLSRILSGAILLLRAETGSEGMRLKPKISETFAILRWIYVGLTGFFIICLKLVGMRWYDAITHSFTVIASGGFSPNSLSIEGYSDTLGDAVGMRIEIALTIFMVMAGINFVLYYHFITGKPGKLFKDPEFRAYIAILVIGNLLIVVNLVTSMGMSLGHSLRTGVFNGVSIMSTTGYANFNFDLWPDSAKIILILFMFIGGCAGSTSGAIKVVRIVVLTKTIKREILKLLHPRSVIPVRLGGQQVSDQIISSLSVFFVIYLFISILATLALTFMDIDIMSALSAVATSMGGVGPGVGLVGPHMTYLGLPAAAKVLLSICMWFGRLEIYAAMILFFPSTYKS